MNIVRSKPPTRRALTTLLPANSRREIKILLARILHLWLAFVRGQLTLMLLVGIITWLGLAVLGVPRAPLLGAIAGVLEIVPSIGPTLSTVIAAIVVWVKGSSYLQLSPWLLSGLVVLFYVVVQLVENYFIVPRVMGDALKLPALLVLAAVIAGGVVGSVPGAVLATPLLATGREVLRFYRHKRRGEEPFPPEKRDLTGFGDL